MSDAAQGMRPARDYGRPAGRGVGGPSFAVIVLGFLLALLVLPPLVYIAITSLYTTNIDGSFGSFTLEYFGGLFASDQFSSNLVNSLVFSVGSGVLAIVIGTMQAWLVERTDAPLRRFVFLIAIISLGIPHVLYASAWLLLLGRGGPVNGFLMALTGAEATPINVYSMGGMIVIEALIWSPLAFLMLSPVFRSVDASFEEAATMSGAGILTTFRKITLPLMTPAFLALMLLVCIRAFEAFDIPAMVGSGAGITVLTTEIYDSIRIDMPPNYGQAGAFSVVLMTIVVLVLSFQRRLLRNSERFQTITGRGFRPRAIPLGRWRWAGGAFLATCYIVLLLIPLAMIFIVSLLPFYDGIHADIFGRMSFENYAVVAGTFSETIGNTLLMGAGAATFVVLLTAGGAWMAVRRFRGGAVIEQLATLPLIFPAIVLSVAFLQIFLNVPFPIYGTLISLVIAATVQYLPYGMRFSYSGALQIHKELEEAAEMSGAYGRAIFFRVVVPLIFPSLVASWLFVMLLSVRAVAMPILLSGPNSKVVSVVLFDLWSNGLVTELAAVGIVWASIMMCVGVLFFVATRRYGLAIH